MRIFLNGNEERAKWHLPVVEAKFRSFVARCKKAGIKQDRFTMYFEEDDTSVFGQYFYGEESIQIYSPTNVRVVKEKSKVDLSVEDEPKTFWVNTTKGYFWVEVKYSALGIPSVVLTPFVAKIGDEWVYPGVGAGSPGMLAGCYADNATGRYVLGQDGVVLTGVMAKKGTVSSTAIANPAARITVIPGTEHEYIIMLNTEGKIADVYKVGVVFADNVFSVNRNYAYVNMVIEGETQLTAAVLMHIPAWLHRKCSGSYFSPNKTIGYHVDIGTDDEYLGNMMSVYGADLLDNTAGYPEAAFNHTKDLYRFASLLSFPVGISENGVDILMVSPTMGFSGDESDKCWGGYGLTQSWAGCVDYQQDFNDWLLSPRLIQVSIRFDTEEKIFSDISNAEVQTYMVRSWDDSFNCTVVVDTSVYCDTQFYSDNTETQDGQCGWVEDTTIICSGDPGSTGEKAEGWELYKHWQYFSREDLRLSRKLYFLFGNARPAPLEPSGMNGFYFMFDGLWHLDIGVLWAKAKLFGDSCGLCMIPHSSQVPGDDVIFYLQNVDSSWIKDNGQAYVVNMEITTQLGWISLPGGGTAVGFIAVVPEEYEAPHDPVLMKGGIRYPSAIVDGVEVYCERGIMSDPCICSGNTMVLDESSSDFALEQSHIVAVFDGCPPFEWVVSGGTIGDYAFLITDLRQYTVDVEDECHAELMIKDACGTILELSDTYTVVGAITGDKYLDNGETCVYYHNLGAGATYTGTLIHIEDVAGEGGYGAVLQMPEGVGHGTSYTVSFIGKCEFTAEMQVVCGNTNCYYEYEAPTVNVVYGDDYVLCQDGNVYRVTTHYIGPSWYTPAQCAAFVWGFVCGEDALLMTYHNIPNAECFSYAYNKQFQCTVY